MRTVLQRVSHASVSICGEVKGEIGNGILCLVGIHPEDTEADLEWMVKKICNLRIFDDADGVMNLSILDHGGNILVVSQFTLFASTKKGNRPSFVHSAPPERAEGLYDFFCDCIKELVPHVKKGRFRSHMKVELVNDGPVTMVLDSRVLRGERSI